MLFCTTLDAPPSGGDVLEQYIARIAHGDREALAKLYQQTRPAVYGFALSILKNRDDAEDILQESYLHIWQAAPGYQSKGKPMAWIMTVVRHLSLDKLRTQGRIQPLPEEDWRSIPEVPTAITPEDRLTLHTLLAQLQDQERQIVVLHALTGLKHREIAALLELPLATVLSKYRRAVKKLQRAWKEGEENV